MIAGMAMLTMVTSSSAMNMPKLTTTRIHHLRGWPWSRRRGRGSGADGIGHWAVLSGCVDGVLPRERERGRRSLRRWRGRCSSVGGDAGRVERSADARRVAAGHAQRAPDEGGREAGRVEGGEGRVPAAAPRRPRPCASPTMPARVPSATTRPAAMSDEAVALPASSRWWVVTSTPAPPRGRVVDGVPERARGRRVDAGGGLVEDEQLGRVGEGRREGEAAAQPERQVAHQRAAQAAARSARARAARAEGPRRERQVLGHAEVLPEAEALRDVAEPPPRRARGRAAEQPDRARRGPEQAEQQPDEGGLAGAVGAEQADHLAGAHLEVDAGDGGERAEAAHDAARRRRGVGRPGRRARAAAGRPHAGASRPGGSAAATAAGGPAATRARPSSSSSTVAARSASSR